MSDDDGNRPLAVFNPTNYYDGQGFMVKKDLGVKSTTELDGNRVYSSWNYYRTKSC